MTDPPTNLVRKYRRWNELSQAELAQRVSVSRQTIANIERGNYSPSVHLALAICRELRQTVEHVFGETTTPQSPAKETPQ
ncbi:MULTISPECIES: helix-turn-helix transcriptional regulator [unclassified Corynebacterium]|uniref:helix-turn-helix transcriptional regulator n=1 Tax=unclassified Corynebacterium TaxID=2624378 RepID=UPI0029CA96A0|nr:MULTISPECIES: helix-turn-helix transcriptional regulator [unclassified Corynebacterium]WPF66959.1 helix-turn-helix transcriptional regulator [Corynebacterium sp. 22KM0430]WPF69447.1 helix-turn-helix transcriptional regulator [Corynebacterium sp. 21KM1197]